MAARNQIAKAHAIEMQSGTSLERSPQGFAHDSGNAPSRLFAWPAKRVRSPAEWHCQMFTLKGTEIMLRTMCKGKIHRATVTQADLNYVGSITIDQNLLDAANIYPYEKVQVVSSLDVHLPSQDDSDTVGPIA